MVGKEPVTPDSLKQQTLDSRVKKTKHGRNIAKKLDNTSEPRKLANGSKPVVKEEVDYQTENRNENARRKQYVKNETAVTTTAVVKQESETTTPPQPTIPEPKPEPKPTTTRKPELKPKPVKTTKSTRGARAKKTEQKVSPKTEEKNQKLTDYFPVRRSKRQPLSKIKDLEYEQLKDKIMNKCTDGLEIRIIDGKGRGVFASRPFIRKEFIVEYSGTLISFDEAKRREAEYAKEPEKFGCYMYYFVFKNKKYCVDGTSEDGSYGRLLNHSKNGNVESKLVNINSKPVLILIAKEDIQPETELSYDYGERSKDIIESHPWLNQ